MKILYTCLLLSSLLFTSCFEYEEELSLVQYGSRDYALSGVLQEDWGAHSGEHYNMDFTIIGETSVFEENQNALGETYFTLSEDFDCYLFTEFFSPGKEGFQEGTFTALGNRKLSEAEGEFVYRRVQFGRSLEEAIFGENGTITIVITSKGVYRMKYDILMENGRKLEGTFIGTPQYLDRK